MVTLIVFTLIALVASFINTQGAEKSSFREGVSFGKKIIHACSFTGVLVLGGYSGPLYLSISIAALFLFRLEVIVEALGFKFQNRDYLAFGGFLLASFFSMKKLGINYYLVFSGWFIAFFIGIPFLKRLGKFQAYSYFLFIAISIQSIQYLAFIAEMGQHKFLELFLFLSLNFYLGKVLESTIYKPEIIFPENEGFISLFIQSIISFFMVKHYFQLSYLDSYLLVGFTLVINSYFIKFGLPDIPIHPKKQFKGEWIVFGQFGAIHKMSLLLVELPLFCLGYYWLL